MISFARTMRAGLLGVALTSITLAGWGCSDSSSPNQPSADRVYWQLTLDHRAVTLSLTPPYDTLQLTAIPQTVSGSPITGQPAATFTVSDPSIVSISTTGLLTALKAGTSVTVVAKLTIGTLTLSDTAIVNVNDVPSPPPVITTLSIQPAEGDSAKVAAGFSAFLSPVVLDANGSPLFDVAVWLWSSDTTVVTIDAFGDITGQQPGHATLYAQATAYGVTKIDSLRYTVGQPIFAFEPILARTPKNSLTPVSYFSPATLTLGVGGHVIWLNQSKQPVDIVFDNPAAAQAVGDAYVDIFAYLYGLNGPDNPNAAGNIPAFAPVDSTSGGDGTGVRIRWFPQAGTYTYHSTLYNTTGSIVVTND